MTKKKKERKKLSKSWWYQLCALQLPICFIFWHSSVNKAFAWLNDWKWAKKRIILFQISVNLNVSNCSLLFYRFDWSDYILQHVELCCAVFAQLTHVSGFLAHCRSGSYEKKVFYWKCQSFIYLVSVPLVFNKSWTACSFVIIEGRM